LRSLLRGRRSRTSPLARPSNEDGFAAAHPLLSPDQIASMDRFQLEAICRAQAKAVFLGDHVAICRLLTRYKLFVDTRDCGFAGHVLLDGYWEMWLTIFMCRHIRSDMVVVDVGANFGYYTILLGDLVGSGGHVYAIEPHPVVATLLRRSVDLNGFAGHTSIIEAAAAAETGGRALLYAPEGEFKNAHVVASPDHVNRAAGALHDVPRISIDDVVSAADRLDFIKIDAEGAEESILHGMGRCLDYYRPSLVVEFNARRYRNPAAVLRRLTAVYKQISYLDYYGRKVPATELELVSERVGEDWLLFFEHEMRVC
jgi:FkbM family methyltransferase